MRLLRLILSVLLVGGCAAFYCAPVFEGPLQSQGIEDWDLHFFYHGVARESVVRYGQAPLWDPWSFGGTPALAHPESRVLTPSFLLLLLCGTVLGLKLEIWLYLVLGLFGMYQLSLQLELRGAAAMLPPVIFMGCGLYPMHLAVGHTWYLAAALLPWVVWLYLQGVERPSRAILAGGTLALMVLGGGTYPAPHAALMLVVLAGGLSLRDRSLAPWRALALAGLFAALLSAVKLLPSLELLAQHGRLADGQERRLMEWPGALYHIFLDPNQQLYADHGQQWSWWEYGCYVGVLPLVLGAVGVMGAVRRHWPLLLAGAVFLAVGLGGWGPSAPWYWLHQLPPFSSHHVPSRLLVGAVLVLSLLAGFGLSCLQLKAARWSLAPALLLIAVAADLTWVHRPVWRAAFSISPTAVSWSPVFRQTAGYPLRHPRIGPYLYPGLMSNRGVVRSEAEVHHQPKAIPHGAPSYRGELFLADSARGSATFSEWSPNKLTVDLALGSPGRLVINQNHDHNWRVFGRQVESYRGLLSVSVDPRDRSVTFYYLPWSVLAGLAITLLGLVAASWFIWSDRSARPRPAEPRS